MRRWRSCCRCIAPHIPRCIHENCCWCIHLPLHRYCLSLKQCQHRLCLKDACQARWEKLLLHCTVHSKGAWQEPAVGMRHTAMIILPERGPCCVQSCSPARPMTTPASEVSQSSPQRRMHSPATPFLDVSSRCPATGLVYSSSRVSMLTLTATWLIALKAQRVCRKQQFTLHVRRHLSACA